MAEAKPIPHELMFRISQAMKGNPDKPEGRLLNFFMPGGIQKYLEDISLGNKSNYLDRASAGMDIADYIPGVGLAGMLSSKAEKAIINMFKKEGGTGYASWKNSPEKGTNDMAFAKKNAKRITPDQINNMSKYDAYSTFMRPTPSSMDIESGKTGDRIMVGIRNDADAYGATHADAYINVFSEIKDKVDKKYGSQEWITTDDRMTSNDYSKRADGFAIKDNNNITYFADRNAMARLVKKATGVDLFKKDMGEAETIKLQRFRDLIKKADLDDTDFLMINDVVEGRISPYELDYIGDRLNDDDREDFLEFVKWLR